MSELYSNSRRGVNHIRVALLTCEGVSTFVRQVSDSINDSIFSGIGI